MIDRRIVLDESNRIVSELSRRQEMIAQGKPVTGTRETRIKTTGSRTVIAGIKRA